MKTALAVAGVALGMCLGAAGCAEGGAPSAGRTSGPTATSGPEPPAAASSTTVAPSDGPLPDATPAIVAAAEVFLGTLDETERDAVLFDADDTEQRRRWSNLPEGIYTRAGLRWGELSAPSQDAWLAVMTATLSDGGHERVLAQWAADDEVRASGGGDPRGEYGRDSFWVAVIGTPSMSDPWQWQLGGHHLTINATVRGPDLSLTPSFLGVQPTQYTGEDGASVRPLGDVHDTALALVTSLTDAQRRQAVRGDRPIDLVAGPGRDGRPVEPEGIRGADLSAEQRALLLELVGHYGGIVNEEDAVARLEQLEAGLDDTWFGWWGPTGSTEDAVYFRVTGPHVLVEYGNQEGPGAPSDHVHGVYRDPTNDYGQAFGAGLG